MNIPEDINTVATPEWVLLPSPDRAKKIEEYYTALHFKLNWNGKEKALQDSTVLERAVGEAKLKALENVTDLSEATETAVLRFLQSAKEDGWYRFAEYDDIRQMIDDKLQKAIERSPNSGMAHELADLLNIISQLEKMGISKELVLGVKDNISKARDATRPLKAILESNAPKKQKLEEIREILSDVVDEQVSARGFRDLIAERMGKVKRKTPPPVEAAIYLIPGGKEIIVIQSDKEHTRAIEHALRGIVTDLDFRDPITLQREIAELTMPRTAGLARHAIVDGGLEQPIPDGLLMPTPEEMLAGIMTAAARFRVMLEQVEDQVLYVPLYTLDKVEPDNMRAWVEKSLQYRLEEDVDVLAFLQGLVTTYYSVPPDALALLPSRKLDVMVGYSGSTVRLVLRVEYVA